MGYKPPPPVIIYRRRRRRRRRRRWAWTAPILFVLVAAMVVGGIVYFVRPDVVQSVAQGVAQEAKQRENQRIADKARKQEMREREVATLTNVEREQNGVTPLRWDSELQAIARSHSKDMAENDYFAHKNNEGDGVTQRGINAGYRCVKPHSVGLGENISYDTGPFSPGETVRGWMNSPGHRENMLDWRYDRIGIGIHEGWTFEHGQAFYATMVLC